MSKARVSKTRKSGQRRAGSGNRQHQQSDASLLPAPIEVQIRDLSHDGRGVARVDGRTVFVEGALPGETARVRYRQQRGKFDEAVVEQVIESSAQRVEPVCRHFSRCGGCQLQHLSVDGQLQHKQQLLLRTLERIGKVQPQRVLPAIAAEPWNYRRRARLAVRCVKTKSSSKADKIELGFRESDSERVVPVIHCPVLMAPFDHLFAPLSQLLHSLQVRQRIPQLELLVAEFGEGPEAESGIAINIHLLCKLPESDSQQLQLFAEQHQLAIYLQADGVDSIRPLRPDTPPLRYSLADQQLQFVPGSFVQVNPEVNRQLVDHALQLLNVQSNEKVLDLYCGLGNFTLPLARQAGFVVGVEGSARAIELAESNARGNNIENVSFYVADLTECRRRSAWGKSKYDAVVLDPPRSGAAEVLPLVGYSGAKKIVYISCHPGTLARDVGVLVSDYGYRLVSATAVEMFPHTAHLESVVLLEKG